MIEANQSIQTPSTFERNAEQHAAAARDTGHRLGRPRPGCRRLLLVDDDANVLEVTSGLLSEAGYDVVKASSGEAALDILSSSSQINFIVTDYSMPGITGQDLVVSARRLCPLLPAVIMTGFAGSLLGQQLPPAVLILKKPFKLEDLVRAVEQSASMMRGGFNRQSETGRHPAP